MHTGVSEVTGHAGCGVRWEIQGWAQEITPCLGNHIQPLVLGQQWFRGTMPSVPLGWSLQTEGRGRRLRRLPVVPLVNCPLPQPWFGFTVPKDCSKEREEGTCPFHIPVKFSLNGWNWWKKGTGWRRSLEARSRQGPGSIPSTRRERGRKGEWKGGRKTDRPWGARTHPQGSTCGQWAVLQLSNPEPLAPPGHKLS